MRWRERSGISVIAKAGSPVRWMGLEGVLDLLSLLLFSRWMSSRGDGEVPSYLSFTSVLSLSLSL